VLAHHRTKIWVRRAYGVLRGRPRAAQGQPGALRGSFRDRLIQTSDGAGASGPSLVDSRSRAHPEPVPIPTATAESCASQRLPELARGPCALLLDPRCGSHLGVRRMIRERSKNGKNSRRAPSL
jgi:hypothetical protein